MRGKHNDHPRLKALIFAGLFFVAIFVLLAPSMPVQWAREFLIVRDHLQPAGLIFVLGGDYELRAPAAAALFHEGLAPQIVVAREQAEIDRPYQKARNFTDITIQILTSLGVPGKAVVQLRPEPPVLNTADECRALRGYLEQHGTRRVIVVTSAIHTRRARLMLHRALKGMNVEISMSPAEAPNLEKATGSEVGQELEKLLFHSIVQ